MTLHTKEDKLKAVDYFMTEILIKDNTLHIRARELLSQFKYIAITMGNFPEMSDIFGVNMSPIDDISYEELSDLLIEYCGDDSFITKLYCLKCGKQYVLFKKDGSVQTVKRQASIVSLDYLESLPFDVTLALESGVITIEEVK